MNDYVDPRERRALEFIVPILYSKKPNRVTKIVGNTIFGTLSKVWKVSWSEVIQEVVGQLVSNLKKEKPSPISPYLFHLYNRNEYLRGDEMDELEVVRKCLEYGVSPETVAHPDVVEIDSERECLSSAEQRKILGVSPRSRRKSTYQSPDRKSPIQNPDWKSITIGSFNFEDDPF